ncbi:DNA-binding ferritin-like protein (Dps family) [Labedaea rhizosphaerae]|uniref:DNA-binding ferritin-like protein (Dps family) n=2 Tax=Labedaea rhizosphaerae TaxID=598644 RepID=A0A4V3CZ29_LABRH|nr:DNA-binding ferritin-like protein (Dps family) [Labedaea rhizosphaerae]
MAFSKIVETVIGPKKQWRQYKARCKRLPENYRIAIEAVERYLMYEGGADGKGIIPMFEDLIDLFEQSAAAGTPIRDIVGEDPVEFVDTFVRNYPIGQWRVRERTRLVRGIQRAAGETVEGEDR